MQLKKTLSLDSIKSLLIILLISSIGLSCENENSNDNNVDNPDDNIECQNAQQATVQAQQDFENASNSEYEDLCATYIDALNLQITECGDEDGSLQSIIDELGDCTLVIEPPVSNAEFYITGLFNEEPIIMQTGGSYLLGCGGALGVPGDPGDIIKRGYSVLLASSTPFNESPAGDMSFDRFYEGPYVPPFQGTFDPAFNSSFPVGNYSHTEEFLNTDRGMSFEFYTKGLSSSSSVYYSTNGGDQTNTVFTITESIPDNYVQSGQTFYRQIVTGTFNCMLYSSDGDPIEVTDGTFRLRIVDECL
ncbi:hypothetical protein [Flavobacteriaceae bacterium 14752]|uniref:hypothetical protein n=1 Tax=Mesohalobacter salilacus TaxID=2491711 RepID=UPI000F63FD76|nr:hypothetical protein EIG84_09590 [Flavobacteriaceae bacterium 14752]